MVYISLLIIRIKESRVLKAPIVCRREARYVSDRKHLCSQCGKTYTLKFNLTSHQRFECGKQKQFKCRLCSYAGSRKHHLEKHMLKRHHTIDLSEKQSEMVPCPQCGKEYKNVNCMKAHLSQDCGKEKLFHCTICNNMYKRRYHLKEHMVRKHKQGIQWSEVLLLPNL
nr:unnamed protein product [Callosobruchus analis]